MKMKLIFVLFVLVLLMVILFFVQVQVVVLVVVVVQGQVGKVVIDVSMCILIMLQQCCSEFSSNLVSLCSYIDSELNCIFDCDYVVCLVLGLYVRGVFDVDIKLFVDVMVDSLMQCYGLILFNIQGKLSFCLKGESLLLGNCGVCVSIELVCVGNELILVEYWMCNVNGQWKIFDVNIEGIFYVQIFCNQFDIFLCQKGIKQVVSELCSGSMQVGLVGNGK